MRYEKVEVKHCLQRSRRYGNNAIILIGDTDALLRNLGRGVGEVESESEGEEEYRRVLKLFKYLTIVVLQANVS